MSDTLVVSHPRASIGSLMHLFFLLLDNLGRLTEARRRKERTYPELLHSRRCRLVVLGIETGGRWSEEAARFVTLLAHAKARQAPHLLQHSVAAALINRWTAMLTHAALQAFAASLLVQDCAHLTNVEGNDPAWSQLLAEAPGPSSPQHLFKELWLGLGHLPCTAGASGIEMVTLVRPHAWRLPSKTVQEPEASAVQKGAEKNALDFPPDTGSNTRQSNERASFF